MRSVMTQPGVYFTLDAPFVSIIGLYSNVLDSGPGVISSHAYVAPQLRRGSLRSNLVSLLWPAKPKLEERRLVEPRGFEPLTSAVRLRRSPN